MVNPYRSYGQFSNTARKAELAFKYGRKAVPAVRKIARMYRRYKKRSKASKRSEPAPKRTRQVYDRLGVDQNINLAELDIRTIQFTPQGTGMGQREKLITHVRGIKICDHLFNIRSNNIQASVEVHWALCQLKCPLETIETGNLDVQNQLIKDYVAPGFFRDNRTQEVGLPNQPGRTRPFVDFQIQYPFDYLCQPLNPDRFHIITHKRFVLNSRTDQSQANGTWFKKCDKYFKLNKNMAFWNEDDNFGKYPFFVAIWYATRTAQDYPTSPVAAAPYISHNFKDTIVIA